eukprot:UN17977
MKDTKDSLRRFKSLFLHHFQNMRCLLLHLQASLLRNHN